MQALNTYKTFLFFVALFSGYAVNAQDNNMVKKTAVEVDNPLEKLADMQPEMVEFKFNTFKYMTNNKGVKFIIAPEGVQARYPELVVEKKVSYMYGKNAYRTATFKVIDEDKLAQVMLASVKEQQAEISRLKNEIDALKQGR